MEDRPPIQLLLCDVGDEALPDPGPAGAMSANELFPTFSCGDPPSEHELTRVLRVRPSGYIAKQIWKELAQQPVEQASCSTAA